MKCNLLILVNYGGAAGLYCVKTFKIIAVVILS
jgi:hypothetical protein